MIGLKSNTLHYVEGVHFWGRFANRGGWQTAPKNVQG